MTSFINTALLPTSLAVIMLSIGLSVKKADFAALRKQIKAIGGGLLLQVLALPVLVFAIVVMVDLPPQYAVALMIIACCPGGVTSNAITFIFSGVVALSVVLTLLSSLVAPLSIPLVAGWSLQYFMGNTIGADFSLSQAITKLFVVSIVPLLFGALTQRAAPLWCAKQSDRFRRFSGMLFVLVIALMAIANYRLLGQVMTELGAVMLVIAVASIALGYAGALALGLSAPYRLTLAIEVGIQNAGMGMLITSTVLQQPTMTMVLIAYGILMQVPMLLFAMYYRRRQIYSTIKNTV